MSNTHAVTRQGNSRPAPYPQQRAGPSNSLRTMFEIDDDSPCHRRHAAGHTTTVRYSKQKAKTPLPPTSEVIEISSDEDKPPAKTSPLSVSGIRKRMKDLEKENENLKTILAVQTVSAPDTHVQTPPRTTQTDELLVAIDEFINCEICKSKMWIPYTLGCGHTFCAACLENWFNTAYGRHLETYSAYNPQRLIPAHFTAQLARNDLPYYERRDIKRQIAIIFTTAPQPQYSCPTCRVLVRTKPAESFVVKQLVRTIATIQGDTPPEDAPRPLSVGHTSDGPFESFFPFAKFM
ncbi:hypothetical protein LXA43DRAFT_1066518 [Ganoderma leucocontextum]|nr:hypothetical protein LXA43DRAFT_1066518 [Ganoderma leucocontextum]